MPREMFGDVVEPSVRVGTKQWYTVPVSILVHTVALTAIVVIPLLATDIIPTPQSMMAFVAPPPPTPPPPPPPPPPPSQPTPQPVVQANPNAAPVEAPPEIKPEPPPAPPPNYAMAGMVGGVAGGIPGGVVGGVVGGIPPPPPPPPAAPVRAGGDIKEPKLLRKVDPIYPPFAVKAKIQGFVYIDAVIAKDGSVKDVKVLNGNEMLKQAAIDAVKQWKYTPTMLGGSPVEVALYVQVIFELKKG